MAARRTPARRALGVAAKTLGLVTTFALATSAGALLHVGMPAPRRFVVARVDAALDGAFKGRLVVTDLRGLELDGVTGVEVDVFDPEGALVAAVHGAEVHLALRSLVVSLFGRGDIAIDLSSVEVMSADLMLDPNEAGEFGIARAFEPREVSAAGGRATSVRARRIDVARALVHGRATRGTPRFVATLDGVRGVVVSDARGTQIDLVHASLATTGFDGKDPSGELSGRADLRDDPHALPNLLARFDGRVGAVRVAASGRLEDGRVDATLDVPQTPAEAVRALAPDVVTLRVPVWLHAEVHGELPSLAASLAARVGVGTLDVKAEARVATDDEARSAGHVAVEVANVDLSEVAAGAPKTRFAAKAQASATMRSLSDLEALYRLELERGRAAGQDVPAVELSGTYAGGSAHGVAQIEASGAPTTLAYELATREGSTTPTDLDVRATTAVDLHKLNRVPGLGHGSVQAALDGHIDLETRRMSASLEGTITRFSNGGISLGYGLFHATAKGAFDAPQLTARIEGSALSAGGEVFDVVRVAASGSVSALSIAATLHGADTSPSIDARARLRNEDGLEVDGARVVLSHGERVATATVRRVGFGGGVVAVDDLRIDGLGEPLFASLRTGHGALTVRARSAGVDVACVRELVGLGDPKLAGNAAFDVDLRTDTRGAHGRVALDAAALRYGAFEGGAVHVVASIDGETVTGEARVALSDVGHVAIETADAKLGGKPLDPRAWSAATGKLRFEGAVDLARLVNVLPKDSLPMRSARGLVSISGDAERARAADAPALTLRATTKGLLIEGKQALVAAGDGRTAPARALLRLEGVDGALEAHVDAHSAVAKLALHDAHGSLAVLDARIAAPLDDVVRGRLALEALATRATVAAQLHVPRRDLDALPSALRAFVPARGFASLDVDASGDAAHPSIRIDARGEQVIARDAHRRVKPADVTMKATYDGARLEARATAAYEGRSALEASATLEASAAELARGGLAAAWVAKADAKLHDFPIEALAALTGDRVRGRASGEIDLRDLHRDASLSTDLTFEDLVLDRSPVPHARARVTLKAGALAATLRLDQSDGFAELTAKGGLAWGAALAPALAPTAPLDVRLSSKNLRIDAVQPLVREVMNELDGRLDADLTAHIEPTLTSGKVSGQIALRDGVFELPAIGERFHSVRAKVTMNPWGTVRIDGLEAQAATGKLTANATATLKGFALQHAEAAVHIAKGDKLPIAVQGIPMGTAYGDIKVAAVVSPDSKHIDVTVNIPTAGVELPQSTGHAVQELEPDEHVRVGVRRAGTFTRVALGPPEKPRASSDTTLRAALRLGEVEVRRDTSLRVVVSGAPVFEIGQGTKASGAIALKSGRLEVQSKRFELEHGTVTFTGDPTEPQIVATAYWDAPDGTRVYADFIGTPKNGKLTMRSEPARTQDEIVALVLFGASDGQLGSSTPGSADESTATKGVGVAGGVMTQGMNKAISGVTSVDIETRVDTSEADNPKPEVSVQLTQRLSAEVAYLLGTPPPGQNPDRTTLTLDYRFHKNWSVQGMVGDAGSSMLDLIWRLRY